VSSDKPKHMPDTNTRILLAEDNQANQLVIKSILEYAGLQVDIVANGQEAVDTVRKIPYDIVLMDISMPEMDGMSATRLIRNLPGQVSKIPIIAITAHALSGDKEHFLEAGMDDYLNKPIDRTAILDCIARHTTMTTMQIKKIKPADVQVDSNDADKDDEYINEAILQQLCRDTDAEVVPEFLMHFIDDSKKRIKIISEVISTRDFKTLEFECHALGSCAAAYGSIKLCNLAKRIENACQQEKWEQALKSATKLLTVADRTFQLLSQRAVRGFYEQKKRNH